nr:hypothetical protein [Bacteroidota bacterium]
MRTSLYIAIFIVVAACVSYAQDDTVKQSAKNGKKEITITGEVVDLKCAMTGMMGGSGEDHKQCAIDCMKGGLPVAILEDKTNNVYPVVPLKGMQSANAELMQYAAQKVTLTGKLYDKNGQKLFIYTKVDQVK